jgi:unsaturated chondroitin disaccharide hydrolase
MSLHHQNTGVPGCCRPDQEEILRRAFDLCVRKTRRNIRDLADKPGSWAWAVDGDYSQFTEGFFEIGNWTSSFFTGMALMAWTQNRDPYFLEQVLRLAGAYREKALRRFLDMHHDAGFLYTLYSVALYKLTGDPAHREAGIAAADALLQRFNPTGGFIRAWGRLDTDEHANMAIIDCMMNLPLLHWAGRETGDPKYHDAAVRQAETTLKCFVRPDDSVCHAHRFDLKTGAPLGPDNYCGASASSYWARGTAWAIYGFALSYKHTGDVRYLDVANRLAIKFNSVLDEELVPVWDFRLPPGEPAVRDASALAVAVCGLQELAALGAREMPVLARVRPMLLRLCADGQLNFDDSCRGILRSAYGNKVAYSSWGDYFLMEALARELHGFVPWW